MEEADEPIAGFGCQVSGISREKGQYLKPEPIT